MKARLAASTRQAEWGHSRRARPVGTELDRFLESMHPSRMGPRLQAVFGGPARCHVLDAKYEPGVLAIVLYEHDETLVRGDLLRDACEAPQGMVIGPGLRLAPFPHDPELPTLAVVMDPEHVGPALATELGASHLVAGLATRCRTRLLRYRPGRRATVLFDYPGRPARYVAKVYDDPAKAAAVAEESAMLAAAADGRTLRIPPTVGHVAGLNLVVQAEVAGRPLAALLAAPEAKAAGEAVAAAGRAVAELHQTGSVTGPQRAVERELHRFGERAVRIASVDSVTGARLGRLAERLLALYDGLSVPSSGPVHGDCKPSQFLFSAKHVYLLDLDHVGVSDQAVDVGTFLASLRQIQVRRSLGRPSATGPPPVEHLGERFLDAYLDTAGGHVDRIRIRWQEAVALERKALRAFARAPRSPLALALAAEADRCLDRMVERA